MSGTLRRSGIAAINAPRSHFSNSFGRRHLQGLLPLNLKCSASFIATQTQGFTHRRDHKVVRYQDSQSYSTSTNRMSYSNANTAHADPYKEKNKDEPGTQEKIEDLASFIKASKFGMMTTRIPESGLLVSRCMALAATEAGGIDLIFHTNTESGKTDDLAKDNHINMAFLNGSGEWASISGVASVIADREMVRKYYSPSLKAWLGDLGDGKHDGSAEDPRIGVIKIEAKTATYATTNSNAISRGVEILSSAVTGNAAQVNKLRELNESEIKEWRAQH